MLAFDYLPHESLHRGLDIVPGPVVRLFLSTNFVGHGYLSHASLQLPHFPCLLSVGGSELLPLNDIEENRLTFILKHLPMECF